MDARDLVRSVKVVGTARGRRSLRSAWRHRRADAVGLPRRGPERARVPGPAQGAEPRPGGGVVRFARSTLRVRVAAGGAVFCGWDGATAEPSYALDGGCPEADERAVLEPDTDGGWRVVSERVTVAVSRQGTVEVRTPGGVMLRRDLPPRWWEPAGGPSAAVPGAGDEPRWVQRSEVAADARFFGLGGRSAGPRLRDGAYRLWNTDPGGAFAPGDDPLSLTMPVQLVVADAGTHLVFHDNSWDGVVTLREGEEGAGLGTRPAGWLPHADGRRPAALLGDRGHPGAGAARLADAQRCPGAAAELGARVTSTRAGGSAASGRSAGWRRATGTGGCRCRRCIWTSTTTRTTRSSRWTPSGSRICLSWRRSYAPTGCGWCRSWSPR